MNNKDHSEHKFVPKGAIAFFVMLLIATTVLWFSLYSFLITR